MINEVHDAKGKLHQIASACQRPSIPEANGTRMHHNEMMRMNSGGITAPVARTTPNSTIDMPNSANDQTITALRWAAI